MRWVASLVLFVGCSWFSGEEAASQPDPQATRLAGEKLCYVFQYAGKKCRFSEDVLEVDDATYRIRATITYAVDLGGQAARMVRYEASIRGEEPAYAVEILGKGMSVDDALDRAAQEWAGLAGTAIADAALDTGSRAVAHATKASGKKVEGEPLPALELGSFRVYPGIYDLRGVVAPDETLDHEGLLQLLASEIASLDTDRPHSLLVSVQFDGKRFVCERATVNGADSARVCEIAETFAWPGPVSRYHLRQFYMLVPQG